MKDKKTIRAAAKAYFDYYRKNFAKLQTVEVQVAPDFTATYKI